MPVGRLFLVWLPLCISRFSQRCSLTPEYHRSPYAGLCIVLAVPPPGIRWYGFAHHAQEGRELRRELRVRHVGKLMLISAKGMLAGLRGCLSCCTVFV